MEVKTVADGYILGGRWSARSIAVAVQAVIWRNVLCQIHYVPKRWGKTKVSLNA